MGVTRTQRFTRTQPTYDSEKISGRTVYVDQDDTQGTTNGEQALMRAAAAGEEQERAMGVIESIRMYPKAIFFSMAMSLCLVQEGYDTSLLGSFFAQPVFRNQFGTLAPDGTKQITPTWASGLLDGTAVGEIVGLQLAGFVAERIGYRKTLMTALVMLTGSIFIAFFGQNLGMLFAADVSKHSEVTSHSGADGISSSVEYLGSIPNHHHYIRRRSLPYSSPPRLDELGQHVLVYWAAPCRWSSQGSDKE